MVLRQAKALKEGHKMGNLDITNDLKLKLAKKNAEIDLMEKRSERLLANAFESYKIRQEELIKELSEKHSKEVNEIKEEHKEELEQ